MHANVLPKPVDPRAHTEVNPNQRMDAEISESSNQQTAAEGKRKVHERTDVDRSADADQREDLHQRAEADQTEKAKISAGTKIQRNPQIQAEAEARAGGEECWSLDCDILQLEGQGKTGTRAGTTSYSTICQERTGYRASVQEITGTKHRRSETLGAITDKDVRRSTPTQSKRSPIKPSAGLDPVPYKECMKAQGKRECSSPKAETIEQYKEMVDRLKAQIVNLSQKNQQLEEELRAERSQRAKTKEQDPRVPELLTEIKHLRAARVSLEDEVRKKDAELAQLMSTHRQPKSTAQGSVLSSHSQTKGGMHDLSANSSSYYAQDKSLKQENKVLKEEVATYKEMLAVATTKLRELIASEQRTELKAKATAPKSARINRSLLTTPEPISPEAALSDTKSSLRVKDAIIARLKAAYRRLYARQFLSECGEDDEEEDGDQEKEKEKKKEKGKKTLRSVPCSTAECDIMATSEEQLDSVRMPRKCKQNLSVLWDFLKWDMGETEKARGKQERRQGKLRGNEVTRKITESPAVAADEAEEPSKFLRGRLRRSAEAKQETVHEPNTKFEQLLPESASRREGSRDTPARSQGQRAEAIECEIDIRNAEIQALEDVLAQSSPQLRSHL